MVSNFLQARRELEMAVAQMSQYIEEQALNKAVAG
jgi:hypothetical protein